MLLNENKKKSIFHMKYTLFVGLAGFEPATPALSRRYSEPAEL